MAKRAFGIFFQVFCIFAIEVEEVLRLVDEFGGFAFALEFVGRECAFLLRTGVEEPELGESLLGVFKNVRGLVVGKISEDQVVITGNKEVGSPHIAMVDFEMTVDDLNCHDHLKDDPF